MKILRLDAEEWQDYQIYPYNGKGDHVSVLCSRNEAGLIGNISIASNLIDPITIDSVSRIAWVWAKAAEIAHAVQSDYEAKIEVDQVLKLPRLINNAE